MLRAAFEGRRLAALFLWLFSGAVGAHGAARSDVRVEIAVIDIPGLTVQLHQDYIAPQLVVGNRTGKLLEILDAEGRVFLKIGPKRAEGDIRAEAFHRSRGTAGADLRPSMLSATPRWQQINAEPAYGWFDPRIATEALQIPYAIQAIEGTTPFGAWQIAARLGGKPLEIRGVFLHVPLPRGTVRARLLSSAEPLAGVQVSVAPGSTPTVFINNRSRMPIEVLDAKGQAFLRIAIDGVWGLVESPAFRAANPDQHVQGRGWQKLNAGSSHAWLEARGAWRGKSKPAQAAGPLNEWKVPLLVGGKPLDLLALNEWVPIAPPPKPGAAKAPAN